jgi:two-component sensor histidine kinase/putative methionine-R-sulfoxide reductase with GAF domain
MSEKGENCQVVFVDLKDKRAAFQELYELSKRLAIQQNLDSLFEEAVGEICRLGDAQACGLWQFVPEQSEPLLRIWSLDDTCAPRLTGKSLLARLSVKNEPLLLTRQQAVRIGLDPELAGAPSVIFPLYQNNDVEALLLIVGKLKPQPSVPEWRDWLKIVVWQFEWALQTAQLRNREQRLNEQIKEIAADFDTLFATFADPRQFLHTVTEMAQRISGADQSIVWAAKGEHASRLHTLTRPSDAEKQLRISKTAATALARKALQEKSVQGWRTGPPNGPGSALVIPLIGQNALIGAVSFYWAAKNAYCDTERDVLSYFTHLVTATVENLQYRQAGEHSQVQLGDLSVAASRMVAAPDSDVLMKTALRSTTAALHTNVAAIALLDANEQLYLDPHAHIGLPETVMRNLSVMLRRDNLLYHALENQETVVASTGSAGTESQALLQALGAAHLACTPLTAGGGPLGVLLVARAEKPVFSTAELTLLSAYANQAALAIRNIHLRENLTKHLDRMATFAEYARTLASSLDMQQTLKTVLESTHAVLETDISCVMLRDAADNELRVRGYRGNSHRVACDIFSEGSPDKMGLCELAVAQDKMLVSKDLARDGRNKLRHLTRDQGPASAMVAPLKSKGQAIGAICVCTEKPRDFGENDRRLLSVLADAAGIAFENARLYEQEKERAALMAQMAHEANHRIRNSLQTIAGLLEVEMSTPGGHSPEEAMRKSIMRIHCVAAVHGILSQREMQQVEMKESVQRIAEIVRRFARRSSEEIALRISGARVVLSSKRAASLSLAIVELLDNALQHGLINREKGDITVSLAQSDRMVVITIADNGIGLAPGFDLAKDAKIGLMIATGIASSDLGGQLTLQQTQTGTRAQIRFPLEQSR